MAQPPVVGIDIGSQLMKAVELHVSPKEGLSITAMAVAPTPPGVIQGGMLTDPQMMAQAVKQMLKDAGIKHNKVIGCIAGQSSVVVRIIEVPRMTPQELAETMKWEVERHVPFAPTEVQMDYQPLPIQDDQDANNPNMSVLLAVAQKDMVNYYVDMLFKAGLDPIAIDIEPLAAGRALLDIENGLPVIRPMQAAPTGMGDMVTQDMSDQSRKETVAIVNIGAANTDISIFEDGMLIFPRSLALAGESLTKAIADGMGYQIDQAERLKIEHAQVLMDRLNEYATQSYQADAVEFPYGQPEEDYSNLRPIGLPDSGPLGSSPFDSGPLQQSRSPLDSSPLSGPKSTSDRISSGPLGGPIVPGSGPTGFGGSGALDLERTQPIQRRTLDLARRGPGGGFSASGFDAASSGSSSDADSMTVQIFDAILPVLSELATELRRSLDYYRSRAAGKNVDRVILCGGTASLPNLDKFLDQELQVPVQVASPFAGLSVTTKSFDPRYLQTIAPLFTVAVGLASRNAVFAANPLPTAKKQAGPRVGAVVGGGKRKISISMPSMPSFGTKGKKTSKVGGGTDSTTLPPTG